MYTLSVMTEIAPDVYLPHAQVIMEMLKETFNSYSNLANPVSCYILETMLNFVPFVEKNQIVSCFFNLIICIGNFFFFFLAVG